MAVAPTFPGVYVQELPSGVRTITGVATSVALFIGRTRQGPLNQPTLCLNYTDFARNFGEDSSVSDMARYVRLFFTNGGTQSYVMRIANGATFATVTLQTETGAPALTLTARSAGLVGESIRALVTYGGANPESNFNIEIFRVETDATGKRQRLDVESWKNLSMNPNSSTFAPTFLDQNSKLVTASLPGGAPAAANGFSQSGRPVAFDNAVNTSFRDAWAALIGTAGTADAFQISVDGSAFVPVNLAALDIAGLDPTDDIRGVELPNLITAAINAALPAGTTVNVSFESGPAPLAPLTDTTFLRIRSNNNGDVLIRPSAGANDAAVPLMLGAAQGGLEVGAHAARRPAPNGITLNATDPATINALGALTQSAINQITLNSLNTDGTPATTNLPLDLVTTVGTDRFFTSEGGGNNGIREKLAIVRDEINGRNSSTPKTFPWRAELAGYRLTISNTLSADNDAATAFATAATNIAANFLNNVRYYSVGMAGNNQGRQTNPGAPAADGTAPTLNDYEDAFPIIDRDVDLFNLMVLPPDAAPAVAMPDVWGPASVFCQQRRAFLLMDGPTEWETAQDASTGVEDIRVGLVKDHSAVYFPRIVINDGGLKVPVGPTGAIAGLMARIDGSRGVWKAPAGTEADLRGIVGIERRFSDGEHGVMNPRGINVIRVFPNGIVSFGARTNDGDDDFASEYKYVPIRRLALFMEESLYRGLKWVVFEPNDEPLWAQIRLNVGAFMHGLFRQGAFQGTQPKDAYFVKCDSETTTQNDRNLGIVNIVVGFAPLKPAEFVILYLQQMAGQIQV